MNRRCAWYTGIELDTHGREATLPTLTLIREDQTAFALTAEKSEFRSWP